MGEALFINTFGRFDAVLARGGVLKLGSRRAEILLTYLAINPGTHGFEALIDFLWDQETHQQGCAQLQALLSRLPESLKPFLIIDDVGVALDPLRDVVVDVVHFERTITDDAGLAELAVAVSHYSGEFFAECRPMGSLKLDEWLILTRESLRQTVLMTLRDLALCYSAGPDPSLALTFARRLVEIEPFMESNHRLYMRLLAETGQTDDAAAQYLICRTIMQRTFGMEPVDETRQLYLALSRDLEITPVP
jgi:DNA-binding SARP family transcriptional activator